jgi:hypothetical protein
LLLEYLRSFRVVGVLSMVRYGDLARNVGCVQGMGVFPFPAHTEPVFTAEASVHPRDGIVERRLEELIRIKVSESIIKYTIILHREVYFVVLHWRMQGGLHTYHGVHDRLAL